MRVVVTDFQSLGKVDVVVEGFTVLVGPSNRGKSALVRAIEAALFNKPGDQFVRVGKKRAMVQLTDLPAIAGTPLPPVTWTKGGGKTVYTIGSETFSKVGQGTPPALTAAGYRDVWIGDKERKRGEYLRPQVASQFREPLFLLDRPGSFVSDVLGAISRHAVLLTAQGRAASDQRTAKQRLGVRQTDLATAQQQFQSLDDVPALAARVEALRAAYAALDAARVRVVRAKALLVQRALLLPLVTRVSPPPDVARFPQEAVELSQWQARLSRGRTVAAHRIVLKTLPTSMPEAWSVVASIGLGAGHQRIVRGRYLAHHRALTMAVLSLPLPGLTPVPDLDVRLAKARGLVGHRRTLVPLVATALPTSLDWTATLGYTEAWAGQATALRAHCARRRTALDMLFRCQTAVRETTTEAETAKAALATVLADNPLCPTCEQPMPYATLLEKY